jgi:hypothetical protein
VGEPGNVDRVDRFHGTLGAVQCARDMLDAAAADSPKPLPVVVATDSAFLRNMIASGLFAGVTTANFTATHMDFAEKVCTAAPGCDPGLQLYRSANMTVTAMSTCHSCPLLTVSQEHGDCCNVSSDEKPYLLHMTDAECASCARL